MDTNTIMQYALAYWLIAHAAVALAATMNTEVKQFVQLMASAPLASRVLHLLLMPLLPPFFYLYTMLRGTHNGDD